jgi:hypothetical protein
LFDTKENRVVKTVDANNGSELDDLAAKWTDDGRYIYFADGGTTKIWEHEGVAEPRPIAEGYPIGPGPTRSSMVIKAMPQSAADAEASNEPKMLLHDAATGIQWPLGDRQCNLQSAQGGRVVYLRTDAEGKTSVHWATIEMQ